MNIRWLTWTFVLFGLSTACNKSIQPVVIKPGFLWEPGPSIPCDKVGDYLGAVLTLNEVTIVGDEALAISFSLIGSSRYHTLENIERYIPIQCVRKFPADSLGVLFPQLESVWDSIRAVRQLKSYDVPLSIAINCNTFTGIEFLNDSLSIGKLPNETKYNP